MSSGHAWIESDDRCNGPGCSDFAFGCCRECISSLCLRHLDEGSRCHEHHLDGHEFCACLDCGDWRDEIIQEVELCSHWQCHQELWACCSRCSEGLCAHHCGQFMKENLHHESRCCMHGRPALCRCKVCTGGATIGSSIELTPDAAKSKDVVPTPAFGSGRRQSLTVNFEQFQDDTKKKLIAEYRRNRKKKKE